MFSIKLHSRRSYDKVKENGRRVSHHMEEVLVESNQSAEEIKESSD